MDHFFDSVNVHDFNTGKLQRKPFQDSYGTNLHLISEGAPHLLSHMHTHIYVHVHTHSDIQLTTHSLLLQWLEEDFFSLFESMGEFSNEKTCY